jgi:hypothetical protein
MKVVIFRRLPRPSFGHGIPRPYGMGGGWCCKTKRVEKDGREVCLVLVLFRLAYDLRIALATGTQNGALFFFLFALCARFFP